MPYPREGSPLIAAASDDTDGARVSPQRPQPYLHGVTRMPKNFVIDRVQTSDHRGNWIRSGRTNIVPEEFKARISLFDSEMFVFMTIRVDPGGQARVIDLRVELAEDGADAITTTTLRRVLVDPMLRAALAVATKTVKERDDVLPGVNPPVFQVEGDGGDENARVYWSPPAGANERTAQAAEVYQQAVVSGSRAPTEAVAAAMGYSRAQAARYIRAARDAGLLPQLEAK
jgi:hypothetical protein